MYNPYLVIPFATWLIAQTLKFSLAAFRGNVDYKNFYASGGMPSAHSAVVSSLAITSLILDGPTSSMFGFTAIFAAIVMYDSFGVRRASGEQAAAINMILEGLSSDRVRLANPSLKLREVLGHTPLEVAAGAVLGTLFAGIFNWQHIQPIVSFLTAVPTRIELIGYAALFGLLLVGGIVCRVVAALKYKNSPTVTAAAKKIFVKTQTIGWLGVVAVAGSYESVAYISWRLWHLIIIGALVAWDVVLLPKLIRTVPAGLASEAEAARKNKWFSMPTKRSKRKK